MSDTRQWISRKLQWAYVIVANWHSRSIFEGPSAIFSSGKNPKFYNGANWQFHNILGKIFSASAVEPYNGIRQVANSSKAEDSRVLRF